MGINIGTNFNYQGADFLDSRQGMPKTLNDLLEWTVIVPLGFEVYVESEWYTYKGEDYWSDITGHWQKRTEAGNDYGREVAALISAVFPMDLVLEGGGTFETGKAVTPVISWKLQNHGIEYTPDSVMINGVEVENTGSHTFPTLRTGTHKYTVRVTYLGLFYEAETEINFKSKKYWGVLKDPESTIDLYGLFNDWGDTWTMEETLFNCTGGYYPVYIIPESLWPGEEEFTLWVGGLRSTDYIHKTKSFINSVGKLERYELIYLGYKQTGNLSIRFGN